MSAEEIAKKLYEISGLKVVPTDDTAALESDVVRDEAKDRTVFSAACGTERYVFAIDGSGEDRAVTAALARALISGFGVKTEGNAERDFLHGHGVPPVSLGKNDYYVFAVYCRTAKKSVLEYLYAMSGADDFVVDMGDGITAFCKKSDDDYRSAGEFGEVLRENLAEEIDASVKIGVGGVAHGASELPSYYACAKTALASGAEFDPQNDVYSYKEYARLKMLSELPPASSYKCIKTALDRNYRAVLGDGELMAAADAFIRHSLNVSEASRSLYVHRNTLIYRLDKIEKMTGLDIRSFNDAMTFRIAYLIFKSNEDGTDKP